MDVDRKNSIADDAIEIALKALDFYGDGENWKMRGSVPRDPVERVAVVDGGQRARVAAGYLRAVLEADAKG